MKGEPNEAPMLLSPTDCIIGGPGRDSPGAAQRLWPTIDDGWYPILMGAGCVATSVSYSCYHSYWHPKSNSP